MIKISENIKKYRQQKCMTQSQLAEVFNVSEQAVSRWENGNTYPDIALLPAIADYFGITIDELMGMESYKDEREIEKLGKMEEAIDIAKEQPTIWETSNFRLIELLTGDELVTHCKNAVLQFVLATYSVLVKLADLDFANDKMTIRDRIAVVDKILKMLELVYEGNYGYESRLVSCMHRAIAAMEVLEGNMDETLDHLEKAAEYAVIYDTQPDKIELTSTLLDGIECKDHYRNFTWTECAELNEKLKQERYDIVRETERFKAIERKIAKTSLP